MMDAVHFWDFRNRSSGPINTNGGNTYAFSVAAISWAKTFVPAACGQGKGEKNGSARPERDVRTLDGSAIRSIVWGPNVLSTILQISGLRQQSRSDKAREGPSAAFSLEGT